MVGPRSPTAGLTVALCAAFVVLQLSQYALAQGGQAALSPVVFYNDADPGEALDVARKNALAASVLAVGKTYGASVVKTRPASLLLSARTHVMMTNTLDRMSEDTRRDLVNLVDRAGSMLVLAATPETQPSYNDLLRYFLVEDPGCWSVTQNKAANLAYSFPGMPLSLLTGSNPRPLVFKCVIGAAWYLTSDGTGPVYMFTTPRGGWVKLLGFDWGSSSRIPDWEPILFYAPPSPPPPPPPPPSPPRPRAPTPPPPTPSLPSPPRPPASDADVILIVDTVSQPSDALRKLQLKSAVIAVMPNGAKTATRTTPGVAAVHAVYDNTYISLSSSTQAALRAQVQAARTLLAIIVTPETTNAALSGIVSGLLGVNIACTKRVMGASEDITAAPFSDYSRVLAAPDFPNNFKVANNTVAIACGVGRRVMEVEKNALESVIVEISTGFGVFRLIGYDFTSGGYSVALSKSVPMMQRLSVTSTIAAAHNLSLLQPAPSPPPPTDLASPPPRPPSPPPVRYPPPLPFDGRIPRIVQFSDLSPLPDQKAKDFMADGIEALGTAPALWPYGAVDGALVHVTFDTTLVRLSTSELTRLSTMVRTKKTVLSIVFTTGVGDTQLASVLAALTGAVNLQCMTGSVPEAQRINSITDILGDLKSDGWRALNVTRYIKCNTGVVIFGVNTDPTSAVVLEMSTIEGGTVRLVGYNFASGGRGDNRRPLSALVSFAASLVNKAPLNGSSLPPLPRPLPPRPPSPPPSPMFYRPPRPPGAALPPRPIRAPPPPLGPRYDAIILVDAISPNNTVDADRKAKYLDGVRELKGVSFVAQTTPGNAPVHVVYDNTYLALPPLVQEDLLTRVLIRQTLLTIIITQQTTAANISSIVTRTTSLANIQCTKGTFGNAEKFIAGPTVINDIAGNWRSEGTTSTSAMSCPGSSPAYISEDSGRPVVLEFLTPGSGSVRFLGNDFSAGARGAGRVSVMRLSLYPDPITAIPKPSPPPNPPPRPRLPPSPPLPRLPVVVRPPSPPRLPSPPVPRRPPNVPGTPTSPPPHPPYPSIPKDAILVAFIADGPRTAPPSGDVVRKQALLDALKAYVQGTIAVPDLQNYPGVSSHILYDNTFTRITDYNRTLLADAVNSGETVLNVMLTPVSNTPSQVVGNILKYIAGYPNAACTKEATAVGSSDVVNLRRVSDAVATSVPSTLQNGQYGHSISCTGIPADSWKPIYYTQTTNKVAIVEVITPSYGIIRLVGFDFTKAFQPDQWANLLSYNLRISAGAIDL